MTEKKCSMIGCGQKATRKFEWISVSHEFCSLHSGFVYALLSFKDKPKMTLVTEGRS